MRQLLVVRQGCLLHRFSFFRSFLWTWINTTSFFTWYFHSCATFGWCCRPHFQLKTVVVHGSPPIVGSALNKRGQRRDGCKRLHFHSNFTSLRQLGKVVYTFVWNTQSSSACLNGSGFDQGRKGHSLNCFFCGGRKFSFCCFAAFSFGPCFRSRHWNTVLCLQVLSCRRF